jgi:hypothetical protein
MPVTHHSLSFVRRWLSPGVFTLLSSAHCWADAPPGLYRTTAPKLRSFFSSRAPHSNHPKSDSPSDAASASPAKKQGEVQRIPPQAPGQFNPDPGGGSGPTPGVAPVVPELLFPDEPVLPPQYGSEPLPEKFRLPRLGVRSRDSVEKKWDYREYPLGREGLGVPPNAEAIPNRWAISLPHWTRYQDPSHETPYQYDTPLLWHPYRQSTLKGDLPILGEEIFTNVTAKNFSLFEYRKLPTPSGVSAATPNSSEFFGRSQQTLFSNDTSVSVDIFDGETSFKPVHWLFRVLGVYNRNWLRVKENNLIDPDPRGTAFRDGNYRNADPTRIQALESNGRDVSPRSGIPDSFSGDVNPGDAFNYIAGQLRPVGDADNLRKVDPKTNDGKSGSHSKPRDKDFAGTRYTERTRDFFALQEAFGEIHISDLSDNYDFVSSRWGIQPFVSDFRGFIFSDTNLGARIFGNWDNNRVQYNLAYFNQREKDTYSDLNTFDSRHQQVFIANVYRQDFIWKGYTTQLSFHANLDDGGTFYDKNGFLTRPAILGTLNDEEDFFGSDGGLKAHDIRAFYLGWTGDGHIGRVNVTHAFYQVFGEDRFNGLAGRRTDINAQMAALELSYDRDWFRLKLSGFYASGDGNPTDRTAKGFDSILDNPFFIGGPFSWYVHQSPNLAGTGVNLKQRDSLIPNLRTSKTLGQSNFVNPGVMIVGLGSDLDVTPKLKAFANANYIWFAETEPIELALQTNRASRDLGLDLSLGFKYRPLLTDNIIFSAGVGALVPGDGYKDIYRRNTEQVPGYGPKDQEGRVDQFLYNGFMTLTLTY